MAINRFDDYGWLVRVVRETLEPVDARTGRLHEAHWSRQELAAVVSLLGGWADDRVTKAAGRLERAIPELVAYQELLAAQLAPWVAQLGEETVALIAWAWRHRQGLGLATAAKVEAAFPVEQQAAVKGIWTALEDVHRGSSLVECINPPKAGVHTSWCIAVRIKACSTFWPATSTTESSAEASVKARVLSSWPG